VLAALFQRAYTQEVRRTTYRLFILFSSLALLAAEDRVSVYTDLAGARCVAVSEVKETGASLSRCPGIGGWGVLVAYDDQRMSVILDPPGGKQQPLNFWDVITTSFSSLGAKAEWRVTRRNGKMEPVALIVRVNTTSEQGGKTSYLAVAKIGLEQSCVTNRVGPVPNANEKAREFADHASDAPCLKALP